MMKRRLLLKEFFLNNKHLSKRNQVACKNQLIVKNFQISKEKKNYLSD